MMPRGLRPPGRRLWKAVEGGLAADWELDPRELVILELAARALDDVNSLELAIKADGLTVEGSSGQPRLNPAVVEVRQGRLAVGRLLGQLSLPDADEAPMTAASQRAQKAAQARWRQQEHRRGHRGAA